MVFNENEKGYHSVEQYFEGIEKDYSATYDQRECYLRLLADIRREEEARKEAFLASVPVSLKTIIDEWPENAPIYRGECEDLGEFEDTISHREKTLRAFLKKLGKPWREEDKLFILKTVTCTHENTEAYNHWLEARNFRNDFETKGEKYKIDIPKIKNNEEQLEIHANQHKEAERQQEVGKKVIEGGQRGAKIAKTTSEKDRRKYSVLERYDKIMAQSHKLRETEIKKQLAKEFRVHITTIYRYLQNR